MHSSNLFIIWQIRQKACPAIQRSPSRTLNLRAKNELHQTLKYEVWSRSPETQNLLWSGDRSQYSHFKPIWNRTIDTARPFYECSLSFMATTSASLRPPVTGFTGNQSCPTKSRHRGSVKWQGTNVTLKIHNFLDCLLSVQYLVLLSLQICKLP